MLKGGGRFFGSFESRVGSLPIPEIATDSDCE